MNLEINLVQCPSTRLKAWAWVNVRRCCCCSPLAAQLPTWTRCKYGKKLCVQFAFNDLLHACDGSTSFTAAKKLSFDSRISHSHFISPELLDDMTLMDDAWRHVAYTLRNESSSSSRLENAPNICSPSITISSFFGWILSINSLLSTPQTCRNQIKERSKKKKRASEN